MHHEYAHILHGIVYSHFKSWNLQLSNVLIATFNLTYNLTGPYRAVKSLFSIVNVNILQDAHELWDDQFEADVHVVMRVKLSLEQVIPWFWLVSSTTLLCSTFEMLLSSCFLLECQSYNSKNGKNHFTWKRFQALFNIEG